jgi:hypothetical protein
MGRPPKYKAEFAEQAAKLAGLGATDDQIADFLGIALSTFYAWRNSRNDFSDAIKSAKDVADERVERSLYQRAVGYQTDAVKIMQYEGKEILIPYRENVQPDVTAQIFWLKNRRKDQWRDRQDHEHLHKVEFTAQLEEFLRALSGSKAHVALEKPTVDAEFEQIILQNDTPLSEPKE